MTAKLRIKAKGIEIEWEGEVDYLKNDLPDLIAAIVAALGITPGEETDDSVEAAPTGTDKPSRLHRWPPRCSPVRARVSSRLLWPNYN